MMISQFQLNTLINFNIVKSTEQSLGQKEEEKRRETKKKPQQHHRRKLSDEEMEEQEEAKSMKKKVGPEIKPSEKSDLNQKESQKEQDAIRLRDFIGRESQADHGKRVKFQEKAKDCNNQVCHACFQYVMYPQEKIDQEDEKDSVKESDEDEQEAWKNDALKLYELVYCSECSVPVHWNCLGEQTPVQAYKPKKFGKEYLLFKCQKCEFKQQHKPIKEIKCIICDKDEGFIKSLEYQKADGSIEKTFYHQICAMIHSEIFSLKNPQRMEFELKVKKEQIIHQKEQQKRTQCHFCQSSTGILEKCSFERIDHCQQRAHGYCIFNRLKEYFYALPDETVDPEILYKDRWNYHIYYKQNTKELEHKILCDKHYEANYYSCFCFYQVHENNMTLCDSCQIWYHNKCGELTDTGISDEKYICPRCKQFREKLQDPFLDIILRRKKFNDLVNEDRTEWQIQAIVPQEAEVLYAEQKFFEQILMAKVWHCLAVYLTENQVNERLIESHLLEQKALLIKSLNITKVLKQGVQSAKDYFENQVKEHDPSQFELKDPLNKDGSKNQDNYMHNITIISICTKILEKCKAECKVVPKEIDIYNKLDSSATKLTKVALELTILNSKPTIEIVQEIIGDLEDLKFKNVFTLERLQFLNKQYQKWEEEQVTKLEDLTLSEFTLNSDLRRLKDQHCGLALQQARYQYFLDIFKTKLTKQSINQIMQTGAQLDIDVTQDLSNFHSLREEAEQFEKEIRTLEKTQRPVQNIMDVFIKLSCKPVRPDSIFRHLERWLESAKWNSRAISFIKNKLLDSTAYSRKRSSHRAEKMDIDEGTGHRDEEAKEFMWTLNQAQELIEQANKGGIYYDQDVLGKVKEKIIIIKKLNNLVVKALQESHQQKDIRDLLRELKEIENYDFSKEIIQIETKLRVINEVQQVVQNDGRNRSSIEQLERLQKQIEDLKSKSNDYPVNFNIEMIMMLRAKHKIAIDLRNQFSDVVKQNQDNFGKTMQGDLRKILTKANKDHMLDMKEEQQVLNNLPASEEWFLQTYDKLKKIGGKRLNTVDFKDYIQLSMIVQDEKEVEALLKSKLPSDQLVGAAKNLLKSLSGVKWLIELRKLVQKIAKEPVNMQEVMEIDEKAKQLGIDYSTELAKENVFERFFSQMQQLVESIQIFKKKLGSQKKLIKTLDQVYDQIEQEEVVTSFKKEIEDISNNLQNNNVSINAQPMVDQIKSQGGELDVLLKLHTWIDFLRHCKQLTQDIQLPYHQCMLLSQEARQNDIPEGVKVIRELKERVKRFEKFNREYSDYKRFRERIRKEGYSLSQGILDIRFTGQFIKKLIDEANSLQVNKDHDDMFDEKMLEGDLKVFEEWKEKADQLLASLTKDDLKFDDPVMKDKFMSLKQEMKKIPVYDKESFVKVQVFDWLFAILDMIKPKESEEPKSIGTWETKMRQSEQFQEVMSHLKNHRIYQMLIYEVDQAKQVIEFVTAQKTQQKSLAAKFNLDKQQNYAFFRNKIQAKKVVHMLELARQSKIDVQEEIRCLDQWLKDYEKYHQMLEQGTLYTEYTFDKLKDIAKTMYLSPIDYEELFFQLKERVDNAEMIKLNLKRIFQEYEQSLQLKMQDNQTIKRLKISRIQYELKLYYKSCNIKGVKEIDQVIEKVENSKKKLHDVKEIVLQTKDLDFQTQGKEIKELLEKSKMLFNQIELDLEQEELEIRRIIFEAELKLFFSNDSQKLKYEEFVDFDKEYDKLRNSLSDDHLQGKFIEMRAKLHDFVRQIKKVETKAELNEISKKANEDLPKVDFTQIMIDKDAQLILGKRKIRESDIVEESKGDQKRRKLSQQSSAVQQEESDEEEEVSSSSSSEGESNESDSSESDSSDGSESSAGSSSSSSDEDEEESEDKQNIAKNRARRKVVPNLNQDFVYGKSQVEVIKKMQKQSTEEEKEQKEQLNEEEIQKLKEENRRQRKIAKKKRRIQKEKEKEKKKVMIQQLQEYRRQQNKTKSTKEKQKKLLEKLEPEQPIQLSSMICQDKTIQNSLQVIRNRIRDQSRTKLKEALDSTQPVFSSMSVDDKREFIQEIESDVHQRNLEVDHFYRKKMQDCADNIKFLASLKDVAELIVRKALSKFKLLLPHHSFKDYATKLAQSIKEKRQQDRQLQRQQQLLRAKEEEASKRQSEAELTIPRDQNLMAAIFPSAISLDSGQEAIKKIKVSESDDSDLESLDDNQGIFSDDEDPQALQNRAQSIAQQYDPFMTQKSGVQYPTALGGLYSGEGYGSQIVGQQMQQPRMRYQYNPFEFLEQRFNRFTQRRVPEPILYDPLKDKGQGPIEKNIAPPGSLLKVWEGQLELAKENNPSCQIFSTVDIQIFQQLPELPQLLPLKGKSKTAEVVSYFLRLKNEKRLIRGWITRRGCLGNQNEKATQNWQENSDKYTKLFDELDSTEKSALFNVFQGVTLYMVPITLKTREFCSQMGITPSVLSMTDDLNAEIQQETHIFAVLGQIKQQFPNKIKFCNPEVLKRLEVRPQLGDDKIASPITSDEEDDVKTKHKATVLHKVKTEETERNKEFGGDYGQTSSQIIKQADDEDDDVDIDELIRKFKSEDISVTIIQETLLPIIDKVKGDKEAKLTQFLQELINQTQQINSQQYQTHIKQENFQGPFLGPMPFGQPFIPYGQLDKPLPGQMYPGQFIGQHQQLPQAIGQPPMGSFQQGIRPGMPGAVFPQSQIPQMNLQLQQATQQIQQRQGFPQQIPSQSMFPQGMSIPQLRPPPGIPAGQMMRPGMGMLPHQQQQFGMLPQRMMGPNQQVNQQQQFRQPYPGQSQNQQKR